MELPFLKNKKNQDGGGGPIERDADATHPDKLLGMVWDELVGAYHSGDKQGFHQALKAFALMTIDQDQEVA